MYSFAYSLETAPRYIISQDNVRYSKEINEKAWTMQGTLYSFEISKQELSALFNLVPNNVYDAINKTKLIYRVDTNDDRKTFYLVIQLKNGDILLALGYDMEENCHIRWLFKLEKVDDANEGAADMSSVAICLAANSEI